MEREDSDEDGYESDPPSESSQSHYNERSFRSANDANNISENEEPNEQSMFNLSFNEHGGDNYFSEDNIVDGNYPYNMNFGEIMGANNDLHIGNVWDEFQDITAANIIGQVRHRLHEMAAMDSQNYYYYSDGEEDEDGDEYYDEEEIEEDAPARHEEEEPKTEDDQYEELKDEEEDYLGYDGDLENYLRETYSKSRARTAPLKPQSNIEEFKRSNGFTQLEQAAVCAV